ncbi:MAG: hypothetical protein NT080_04295 [Spirochaetes bacterium]|nr:hypothetical protein [Spirochaetota bacterium]
MNAFCARLSGGGAILLAVMVAVSCASLRSEYASAGETPMRDAASMAELSAWQVGPGVDGALEPITNKDGQSAFQFKEYAGVTLSDSLVGDFRMSFRIRLDPSPGNDRDTWAMVNFRNYFNRRYCLIIEQGTTWLAVARERHDKLDSIGQRTLDTGIGWWHDFEIVAAGNEFHVFRDGVLIIHVVDEGESLPIGNIWFENHSRYSFSVEELASLGGFAKKAATVEPTVEPGARPDDLPVIAVITLENLGVVAYEASLLSDLFASSLLATGRFRILERSRLDEILDEQELQLSGLGDEDTAVRIGGMLNARYIAVGSVGQLGSGWVVSVRLISVESGETVSTADASFVAAEAVARGMGGLCSRLAAW